MLAAVTVLVVSLAQLDEQIGDHRKTFQGICLQLRQICSGSCGCGLLILFFVGFGSADLFGFFIAIRGNDGFICSIDKTVDELIDAHLIIFDLGG